MEFNKAISILKTGDGNDVDEARHVVTVEVAEHCTKSTDNLGDWIANGSYTGSETPQSIAAEWDSYTAD
jgi:hypothetical protein